MQSGNDLFPRSSEVLEAPRWERRILRLWRLREYETTNFEVVSLKELQGR